MDKKISKVISMLEQAEIDGETMQYIVDQTGMRNQILRQLVLNSSMDEVMQLLEEKQEIENKHYEEVSELKEFLVTETCPATIVKKYRVTAINEEEAVMSVYEEKIEPFQIKEIKNLDETEIDIELYDCM